MGKKTTASLVLALSSALVPTQETKAAVQNNFSLEDFSLEKFFQKKQSFKIAAILNTKSDRGLLGFSPGPSYSGQDSNIKCYANTTDNSAKTLQDKLTCGVGQQPSQDLSSCVPCPEGTYSDSTSSDICTACAPGYEPNLASGATSCVACPEGEYSPLGKECKACTNGLLNVGKTTCTYCSRYQYHKIETGNTEATCDSCLNWCESLQFKTDYPSITYPTDNEDAITYCKKRAYVETDDLYYILGGVNYGPYHRCNLCGKGFVANQNTNACIPVFCEGGQIVNNNAECEWCNNDQFTTGQQSECFSCTNYGFDHAFNDSRTACTLCTGRTEPTKISAVLWASLGKDPNDYDTYAHLTCQDIFENTPTDSESCQEMGYRWYVSDEYFTDEHCVNNQNQQVKLYQIRSCAGQLGGLIQKATNLSKDSWISEKTTICGVQALDGTWADARVEGNSNITPDDYLVIKRNTIKETDLLGDVTLNETVTNSIHLTGSSATHNTINGIAPIVINDGFTMTGGTLNGGTFSGGVVSGGTIGQATMTGGNVGGDTKIGLTGTGLPDTTSSIVISSGTINGGNINGAVDITGSSICPAAGCSALTILGNQNTAATYASPRTRMTLSGGTILGSAYLENAPIISGGVISGGYVGGDAEIRGGAISGGEIKDKVIISGMASITGSAATASPRYPSIYGQYVTISGGTISGTSTSMTKIYSESTNASYVVNITGGTISGGTILGSSSKSHSITFSGGTMTGGSLRATYSSNGNISVLGGITISDSADIRGGTLGTVSGSNAFISGGVMTGGHLYENAKMYGGSLQGGDLRGSAKLYSGYIMDGSVKDNAIIGILGQNNSEGPVIYGGNIFGSAKILGKAKTCYWNGAVQSSCTASISGGTIQGTGSLLTSYMGSDPGVYVLSSANISGGTIGGSTVVYNNAHITGGTITGGINWINGGTIQENAQISGNSEIRGTVGGNAIIKEPVYVPSSLVTGGTWNEVVNYSKSSSSSSTYPACITTLSSIPTAGTSIINFSRVCTQTSSKDSDGDRTYTTTNLAETVTCINNTLNLGYNMPGKVIIPVGVKLGNGTFDSRNIFPDNSTAHVCWNDASNTGISNCSFTYGVSATARTTSFDIDCPHGSGCSYGETCDEGQVVCKMGTPTNFNWTAPQVLGGTINGQNVILYTGTITGGTITGEDISLRGTTLSNGTLSGTDLTLTNSTISGGTVSGSGVTLANSTMTNGVISGTSVEVLAGTISGGEIKNFVKVNTTGTISGGIIQGVEASSRTESIPCAATFNNYYSCSSGYDCHCGCSGCDTCYDTILGGCACVMVSQSKSCSWPRTYNLIYGTTSVSGGTICPKYTASSSMINGCTIGRTWSTSSYTSGTLSSNSGRCTNLCELTCSTVSATNVKTSGSGCSVPSPQSGCSGI